MSAFHTVSPQFNAWITLGVRDMWIAANHVGGPTVFLAQLHPMGTSRTLIFEGPVE